MKIMLKNLIEEGEVDKIFREKNIIVEYKKINKKLAKKEIECFLLETKQKKSKISVFDIVSALKLPPEQVEEILNVFETQGRISEIDE